MTERKWTPGPWLVKERHGCDQLVASDGTSLMGNETYYPWTPENMADWRLIAAAPDLYEALENARDALKYGAEYSESNCVIAAADRALAKARGENQ